MRHKATTSRPLNAASLELMRELPLAEVPFGQLIAIDDDARLTWGFRAHFETESRNYIAGFKNTTGGNGASCIVIEEPEARVLVFEKYVLQPDYTRWVNIGAFLNVELMHTALILEGDALKVVAYVKNSGRVRTDAFLLDLATGAVTAADPAREVTTFSGFKIGVPGPGDYIDWVFHTHRGERK